MFGAGQMGEIRNPLQSMHAASRREFFQLTMRWW